MRSLTRKAKPNARMTTALVLDSLRNLAAREDGLKKRYLSRACVLVDSLSVDRLYHALHGPLAFYCLLAHGLVSVSPASVNYQN